MKNTIPPNDILEQTENDSRNVNAEVSIQESNSTNSNNAIFKLENLIKIHHDFHQYIKNIDDPEKIYYDKKAVRTIYLIINNVYCANDNKLALINLNFQYDYAKTISNLLDYSLLVLIKCIDEEKNNETKEEKTQEETNVVSDEKKKVLNLCKNLMNTLRSYSNYSIKFCNKFHEYDGIRVLTNYVGSNKLLDYYVKESEKNDKTNFKTLNTIVRGSIGSFVNLSRVYDSFTFQYETEKCVEKIINFSQKLKDIFDNRMSAYVVLASICNDQEIDKFSDLKLVIPEIVDLIRKCSNLLKPDNKKNLKRFKVQLDEDKDDVYKICKIDYKGTTWHLVELLNSLYHMAVNDSIKYDIYYTHKMNEILRDICNNGNDIEIEYALKLLYQLCFDKRIAHDVENDKSFYDRIKELSNKPDAKNSLSKTCNGIMWLNENEKPKEKRIDSTSNQRHIMISYNKDSRDLCISIKNKLEENNFKVWIDVNDIHGNSLESMANAVEDSMCVLVCMTEKYKQSSNCRAEAEYAFSNNKPIIPLIMQSNYKPNGWLGIILGSKIYIDFTKYNFEECFRRLKQEITQIDNQNIPTANDSISKDPVKNNNNSSISDAKKIENWNEKQVDDWLNEKKIHPVIVENVRPSNGKLLSQLFSMQQEAPEFFYSSISSNKQIVTREIAHFAFELKTLFLNK